jgi:hypothetical protein
MMIAWSCGPKQLLSARAGQGSAVSVAVYEDKATITATGQYGGPGPGPGLREVDDKVTIQRLDLVVG